MNKVIRTILTLSILYWTMFYIVEGKGLWLPIPFILIGIIWFFDYDYKNYKDKYEVKQNNNGEYYIWDNKKKRAKDLKSDVGYWWDREDEYFKDCLTTSKEKIENHYNRLIS